MQEKGAGSGAPFCIRGSCPARSLKPRTAARIRWAAVLDRLSGVGVKQPARVALPLQVSRDTDGTGESQEETHGTGVSYSHLRTIAWLSIAVSAQDPRCFKPCRSWVIFRLNIVL
jgi:hypothetical protein